MEKQKQKHESLPPRLAKVYVETRVLLREIREKFLDAPPGVKAGPVDKP